MPGTMRTWDTGRTQYFVDYGTYDLATNVKIVVWF